VNRKTFWMIVLVLLSVTYISGCGSSSHVTVSISTPPPAVLAPGGTAQIIATITGTSEGVNWSCTPVGTCGSFNPTSTTSGMATTYTAPTTVGPVVITATSEKKASATATANVNIQVNNGISGNFAFYASGVDGIVAGTPTTINAVYSIAGAVTILADGTLTGEQDYNDGNGLSSPAIGDVITSGNLSIDANGFGTMTLVTNNTNLGASGTETFTVNFVNNDHALIIQSDGVNTSSGSMDLQTLPSTLSSNFAFALSGLGNGGEDVALGGVFAFSGTPATAIAGTYDLNDAGVVTTQLAFTGTVGATVDAFGRGTITITSPGSPSPIGTNWAYYVIGPEAIRIVVTNPGAANPAYAAVGSAFGQGSGTFTNTSLPTSVFFDQGTYAGFFDYDAVGQIVPNGSGTFSGIADINEVPPDFLDAATISGTYTIGATAGANGYGSLTVTMANGVAGGLIDLTSLGVYMVDSTINVEDPNNASGGGGALVVDLSLNLGGVGVLVPQTSTSNSDFTGNYVVGFQDLLPFVTAPPVVKTGEVDFVGNAAVTTSLTGSGTISDPFGDLGLNPSATVSFAAPITPDPVNTGIGRYTIDPFSVSNGAATPVTITYDANVYQASGGQLFWIEDGADGLTSVFGGQLQQQGTIGVTAAKKKAKK
jgi:hypothetical protein